MDETLTNIKAHELQIVGWTLIEDQQLVKFNLKTYVEPQMVNINAQLGTCKVLEFEGIQRCFCMDIQRSERDSTKIGMTHN